MKRSYFPEAGIWLKGNTHSHTTVSDGVFTPEELAKLYVSRGYDFLSMTDHNVFVPHSEAPELIQLTGVEHDIEYSADKCTHVVGLGAAGKDKTGYECRRYSKEELKDQQLVDMMHDDGQFVSLAHPYWSRMEAEEIFSLDRLDAIEVYNNGTEHLCHGGNAEVLWDMMLRRGKRLYATACDDVHVPCDLFGGWLWVKAAERSAAAVLAALHSGAFYATSGPQISDFGIEDGEVYVACSPCRAVHFVTYPPRGESLFANGGPFTEARHKLTGRESYVRVVCEDSEGHCAWSQPIYF